MSLSVILVELTSVSLVSFPYDIYDKFNNPWFWTHVAISHFLVSGGIVLDWATLPPHLSQMKHVFNGVIDVVNLDCVLHWLTHSYVSLCLRLLALSSFKAHVNKFCAMMLNGSLIQPQCLPHHLTGLGQGPQVVRRFKETAWHFRWSSGIQSQQLVLAHG